MERTSYTVPKAKCLRCGWTWTPRVESPRMCPNPKCHSVYWDRPPKASVSDKSVENDR
jgi:predicted Zn-ribbon and HTH transcriptional regulator